MSVAQGKVASLFVEFRATVNKFAGDMTAISREVRAFDRIVYPIGRRATDIGLALSAGLTAPIIAAGAFALKTGMEFESAFAGVRKTLNATEPEFAKLRAEFIKMSTEIPLTAAQFAEIGKVAAQLGIKVPDIARFTQTMAELGATTNLTATDAATVLARFTNITQLPQSQIHNLGSTLVALGNNFAATESEIANFALRIAAAGKLVGLTDAQILGFATGLVSVGVNAEAGGTAISRVFIEIDKAVKAGNERLTEFAAVAGMSSKQFATAFKTDAAEATTAFVEGLSGIEKSGGNVFNVLDKLHLSNVRIRDVLLRAAVAGDQLRSALALGSKEFEKNGELTRAANERYKTTENQLNLLKNQVTALGISLFDTLAPAINNTVLPAMKRLIDEGLKPAVEWFAKLPDSTKKTVEQFALLAVVAGPALIILNKIFTSVGGLVIIFGRLIEALGGLRIVAPILGKLAVGATVVAEVYSLARAYEALVDARENAAKASAGSDNAVFAAMAELKTKGIVIDPMIRLSNLTIAKTMDQLRAEVMAAGARLNEAFNAPFEGPQMPLKVAEDRSANADALIAAAAAREEAAKELERRLKTVRESFVAALKPANDLNVELDEMLKHFSASEVISVYGKKIIDAADAQKQHGFAVTGATARLLEQARVVEKLEDLMQRVGERTVETITSPTMAPGPLLPANETMLKALENFAKARTQINELARAIKDLSSFTPHEQIQLFSADLEEAARNSKQFSLDLDPAVEELILMKRAAEEAADAIAHEWQGPVQRAATEVEKTWAHVAANIVTDFSRGIAEAILHTDSLVGVFKKVAQSIARSFIETIVAQLFEPLRKQFEEWGKKLAGFLAKVFKDAMSGAFGPIVAVIAIVGAAVAGIVRTLTGNTHVFASQFTKETQNPFAESLTQTINAATELYRVGRQTYEGAIQTRATVEEMWASFQKDAAKFGQEGRKQAQVAAAGVATLAPIITQVMTDLAAQIEALTPPAVRVVDTAASLRRYRDAVAANTAENMAILAEQLEEVGKAIAIVRDKIAAAQNSLDNVNVKELEAELKDLADQWDALYSAMHPIIPEIYSFAEAVKAVSETLVPDKTLEFVERVINATAGAANLEEALSALEEIGTPIAIIVDRLGSDIQTFADALAQAGLPIPPLIEKYLQLANAQKIISNEMPRIANSLSKLVGDAVDSLRNMAGGGDLAQSILDALAKLLTALPPTATVGVAIPNAAQMQVTINIADNEQITNSFTFTEDISRAQVREDVIPEITEALTNNTDSVREKWIKIFRNTWNGMVTQ